MRFSADWLLSLPARKSLMAFLASAAVSCRQVSMRRWRNKAFQHFLFVNRQSFGFGQNPV